MPWDKHEEVVKHVVRYIPPGLLLDPTFREGFAQLKEFDLSFDVWMYFTQLQDVASLARAFPDTTIIVNHVGGPICVGPYSSHRAEVFEEWRKNLAVVASFSKCADQVGRSGHAALRL